MHKVLTIGGALALFFSLRVLLSTVTQQLVAQDTPPCKDCRPAVTLVEP